MYINRSITQPFAFKSLTAATTLTATDSGRTYGLALAAGFSVTLPAVAEGLYFKFIATIAPTGNYSIRSAATDIIIGHILSSGGAAEDTEATAGADAVNFIAAAGAGKIGDTLEVFSDGTYWYASGRCATAAGMLLEEV